MENKIPCSVVKDLLPNYIEKLTDEETNRIIENHLKTCAECRGIYEEMTDEIQDELSQKDTLEKEKASTLLKNAKVGNAFQDILKVTRILTIMLYVILNIAIWYTAISPLQYFSITDIRTIEAMAVVGLITILIPGILISILFIKKQNTIVQVVKIVIQVVLLVSIPFTFLMGVVASMVIPSSTTDPLNYNNLEICVEEKLAEEEFSMLPDEIPNNVDDIEFSYHYAKIASDNCLTMEISYTYQNEEDYENEKARMQVHEPINEQVIEDGFQMYYTIGQDIEDEQNFRYGFDDSSNRVTYRISYDWI